MSSTKTFLRFTQSDKKGNKQKSNLCKYPYSFLIIRQDWGNCPQLRLYALPYKGFNTAPPIENHCQKPANCLTFSNISRNGNENLEVEETAVQVQANLGVRFHGMCLCFHLCSLLAHGMSSEVRSRDSMTAGQRRQVWWKT